MILLGAALAAPAMAQQPARPVVDAARVIAALDVCRGAPQGREATIAFARTNGFRDLPADEQRWFPMPQFVPLERERVWLRTKGPSQWGNRGGNCEVLAPVAPGTDIALVERALEQKFGMPGLVERPKTDQTKSWRIGGRYFSARIISGELQLFMAFPEPSEAEVAAAREAEAKAKAERIAVIKAATVFSPPAEFGSAAVACMAALGPKSIDVPALEREGWTRTEQSKTVPVYQHAGTAVRVMIIEGLSPGGQCVVDGYAADQGQFKPVRNAIRDALTACTGNKPKMPSPVVPNGQGYVVGDLMMILSTDQRINGLSVRITSARLGGM